MTQASPPAASKEIRGPSPTLDDDPIELYKFAESLITDCKLELTIANLNSAIFLLQDLTAQYEDSPMTLSAEALFKTLCTALWTRFIHTANKYDIVGALNAHVGYMRAKRTGSLTHERDGGTNEHQDMLSVAISLISDFHNSMNTANLDTAILLYRQILDIPELPEAVCLSSLHDLATALVIRFQSTQQVDDIQEGMSFYYRLETPLLTGSYNTFPLQCLVAASFIRSIDASGYELDRNEVKRLMDESTSRQSSGLEIVLSLASDAYLKFKQDESLSSLDDAIALYKRSLQFMPTFAEEHFGALNNLGLALFDRYEATRDNSDLDESIVILEHSLRLQESDHRNHIFALGNLLNCVLARYQQTDDLSDLDEALSRHQEAVTLYQPSHPRYAFVCARIIELMRDRYEKTSDIASLEEGIQFGEHVLGLIQNSENHLFILREVVKSILTQNRRGKDVEGIDKAIPYLRQARIIAGTETWVLDTLGRMLFDRFNFLGEMPDLDEAITIYQEMLNTALSPNNRATTVINLAKGLTLRLVRRSEYSNDDYEEAVSTCRNAVESGLGLQVSDPLHASLIYVLAKAIFYQYDHSSEGSLETLQEAIDFYRRSLELYKDSDRDIWHARTSLAGALVRRFQHTAEKSDVTEAITLYQNAIQSNSLTEESRRVSLINLAQALLFRFDQDRHVETDLENLENAINFHREALSISTPAQYVQTPDALAAALARRFKHTGNLADLDECITLCYQGLDVLPSTHPRRVSSLMNLAAALSDRYFATKELSDMNGAISLFRELQAMVLAHRKRASVLHNLAHMLETRYSRIGRADDLDESVSLCRELIQLDTDSLSELPDRLNSLAWGLRRQFERTKDLSFLDEAIRTQEEAIKRAPSPRNLNTMASLISLQYFITQDLADGKRATELYETAIQTCPEHYPELNILEDNLASHLMTMYTANPSPQLEYLESAMDAYRSAVNDHLASPLNRFNSAITWAKEADLYSHPTALEAYQSAISFLPRIITLDLDLKSRQQTLLSNIGSVRLASNAARCAIDAGDLNQAIEMLEQGRGVFWSQALRLRTPLDRLKSASPELADRLREVSNALEHGSWCQGERKEDPIMNVDLEREGTRLRRLTTEYAQILDDIQHLDGFSDFLLPKSIKSMQKAANGGFIVILNAADARCDALIICPNKISCLPLPDVDYTHVKACHRMIQHALAPGAIRSSLSDDDDIPQELRDYMTRKAARISDRVHLTEELQLQGVLWLLWKDIVKPVLQFLGLEKSESPPRLWWCPTGPMAFLPLHAAGDGDWVFEYVISSYVPSISALVDSTESSFPKDDNLKMVVITDPYSLHFTKEELSKIKEQVPQKYLEHLPPDTTVTDVLDRISYASIVHFACHGRQEQIEPLKTHLLLPSGRLEMAKLMQKPMPNAVLAFLSACETAMGDEDMEDEVIHMAATMLFARFKMVVGTMWSIQDNDGPKVTEAFYRYLFQSESVVNLAKSAEALHYALKELREQVGWKFMRWVPFLHYGL